MGVVSIRKNKLKNGCKLSFKEGVIYFRENQCFYKSKNELLCSYVVHLDLDVVLTKTTKEIKEGIKEIETLLKEKKNA